MFLTMVWSPSELESDRRTPIESVGVRRTQLDSIGLVLDSFWSPSDFYFKTTLAKLQFETSDNENVT